MMNTEVDRITNGSVSPGFMKDALDELFTYYTPPSIVDFINIQSTIGNPPYDTDKRKL